jgi:flagellar motility protein MotE (MotC chaperone)
MDPAAAARIVEGMCANQQDADAVKVLFYMKERAVGKLLAEITQTGLAARLCEQMKRVKE